MQAKFQKSQSDLLEHAKDEFRKIFGGKAGDKKLNIELKKRGRLIIDRRRPSECLGLNAIKN